MQSLPVSPVARLSVGLGPVYALRSSFAKNCLNTASYRLKKNTKSILKKNHKKELFYPKKLLKCCRRFFKSSRDFFVKNHTIFVVESAPLVIFILLSLRLILITIKRLKTVFQVFDASISKGNIKDPKGIFLQQIVNSRIMFSYLIMLTNIFPQAGEI